MIELTTGVVFLMSSLYGSGQATSQASTATDQAPAQATTTAASSFTNEEIDIAATIDPKVMEAYLRKEFADKPILVDIARCESNFRHFDKDGVVIRGRVDNRDLGVMQINLYYQGDTAEKLGMNLATLKGNIAYAEHLYDEQGTKPWISSSKCWMQSASANSADAVAKK